jgi:hypothetical protein
LKAQTLVAQSQYLEVSARAIAPILGAFTAAKVRTAIIAEQHIVIGRNISRLEP